MKKFVLLGLIGFVLTGCGDDKVTKEYLVGDWQCNWKLFTERDGGSEGGYRDLVGSDEYTETIKIINGELYQISNDELEIYDIDFINNNPTFEILNEDTKHHGKRTLEKINNNQYRDITVTEYKTTANGTSVINMRDKYVTICDRINY